MNNEPGGRGSGAQISNQSLATMPGTMLGINATDEVKALVTYGMMAVELRGNAGQELNLAPNKEATLHFPLPSSVTGAPESIDLWSMDEQTGFWRLEGTAAKVGNEYVASVGHFSFWNCDIPHTYVQLKGDLVDENGDPVANQTVNVQTGGVLGSASAITDANGHFEGFVPDLVNLTLTVVDICQDQLYTSNLGSLTSNTDLGDIVIATQAMTTITGSAEDCSGGPLTNGIAYAFTDLGWKVDEVINGEFNLTVPYCDAISVELTVLDNNTAFFAPLVSYPISLEINVGTLVACSEFIEAPFCSVTSDSINFMGLMDPFVPSFLNVLSSIDSSFLTVEYYLGSQSPYFEVSGFMPVNEITGSGSYPFSTTNFSIVDFDNDIYWDLVSSSSQVLNITEYGGIGGLVKGKMIIMNANVDKYFLDPLGSSQLVSNFTLDTLVVQFVAIRDDYVE
jgi:hypothetical protein